MTQTYQSANEWIPAWLYLNSKAISKLLKIILEYGTHLVDEIISSIVWFISYEAFSLHVWDPASLFYYFYGEKPRIWLVFCSVRWQAGRHGVLAHKLYSSIGLCKYVVYLRFVYVLCSTVKHMITKLAWNKPFELNCHLNEILHSSSTMKTNKQFLSG